jgi:hypothetical protein
MKLHFFLLFSLLAPENQNSEKLSIKLQCIYTFRQYLLMGELLDLFTFRYSVSVTELT